MKDQQMIEHGADRAFTTMLESDRYQHDEAHAAILGFLAGCVTFVRVNSTLARRVTRESALLGIVDEGE